MSTEMTWQTPSTNSDATESFARKLGKQLKGGETIELVSDVGGGKTTFVRGLAQGARSSDKVASPSFTLSREYQTPSLRLYHFDFYRLNEAGIMQHELAEIVGDPKAVVIVEWADIVQGVLPPERLTIHIKTTGENTRELQFSYPKSLEYLMQDLI